MGLFETKEQRQRKAEKAAPLSNIKQAGKGYVRREKERQKAVTLTEREKYDQRIQDLTVYQDVILRFEQAYPDNWAQIDDENARKLLQDYYMYIVQGNLRLNTIPTADDTDAMKEYRQQATARDKQDSLKPEEELKDITDVQKDGLRSITIWLMNKADKSDKVRFVTMVANLPARSRLLMYFLIERKKRRNPSMMDVVESQSEGYTPNLEAFNKQMTASVTGKIYWDKLEDTIQVARSAMPLLSDIGKLGDPENVSAVSGTQAARANVATSRTSDPQEQRMNQARALYDRRNALASQFVKDGIEYRKLLEKGGKKDEVEAKRTKLVNIYSMMQAIDDNLRTMQIDGGQPTQEQIQSEKTDNRIDTVDEINEAAGTGWGPMSFIGDSASFSSWGLPEIHENNLDKAGKVFGGVAAITAVVSGVIQCVNLVRQWGSLSGEERALAITQIASSAAEIISYGLNFGSENLSTIGGGTIGIATGLIGAGLAGKDYMEADNSRWTTNRAAQQLLDQPNLSEEDREWVEEMSALNDRITQSQQDTASLQILSSALSVGGSILSLSGALAPAGAILSLAGSVVGIAASIKKYKDSKRNQEATIENFIHIDRLYRAVENGFKQQNKPVPVSQKQAYEEIKDDVQAMYGFASRKSFYNFITLQYAEFLYKKAFYKESGEVITRDEAAANQNYYADMLRGMYRGKLVYPTDKNQAPAPQPEDIAAKLTI